MQKLTDRFKDQILEGLVKRQGPVVRDGKGRTYLRFDEIVVRRLGPAWWSAEIRWKGESTVSLDEHIHVDVGGSISFKCLTGRIPFSLES